MIQSVIQMNIRSSSKKKTSISPNNLKTATAKQRSKTENSAYTNSTFNNTYNKDHIKNTLKKIVASKQGRQDGEAQDEQPKFKTRMEISIPSIRNSLTPKGGERKQESRVHSTKHNQQAYHPQDLKSIFDKKKYSKSKNLRQRAADRTLSPKSNFRKIQEDVPTLKFNKEDEVDPRLFLTSEEYQKFGNRFPDKFKRVALLGRGGFSVVWLGVNRASRKKIAIKQILTKNPHQTHLKQIWFGSYFFEKGGEPRQQFENHIGIGNICSLISHQIHTVDSWLYYQVCEESLGSSLYELKSQISNNEKLYKITYKPLLHRMRQRPEELRNLVVEIAKALLLINSHNIVHSDLKTENILLKIRRGEDIGGHKNWIKSLKLIDFGSSFLFTNLKQFSMATPQYMPPEILNYILYQNKLEYDPKMLEKMEKYINPWTIDVWSLGCIVLQIVSGIPLWMSIPTRIEGQGTDRIKGLFAAKGRLFNTIINKQIQVVEELDLHLQNHNYSNINIDQDMRKVLKGMLSLCPDKRISPFNILKSFGINCEPSKSPFY